MNKTVKNSNSKVKYSIHWETHPHNVFKGFCSLMEHQSLVDVLLCCGNNTLLAHKVVLAVHSPLFREEFERNSQIEQVVINGCEFAVLKCLIEIMYCGQTIVPEHQVNYLVALIKLFGMKCLENLFLGQITGEEISLPKPQFVTKKPKFPAYPFNTTSTPVQSNKRTNVLQPINYDMNMTSFMNKGKLRLQAEQACVKEAQASKMALATLQKEIAAAPQENNFIIEESCTETTVENFIPDSDQPSFVQIVNYPDVTNTQPHPNFLQSPNENPLANPLGDTLENSLGNSFKLLQNPARNFGGETNKVNPAAAALTADKIKHLLETEMPSNVEVMYKTSDGSFVPVTEEVLQNLSSKEGLQYQVIDENGQIGEIQELLVLGREKLDPKNFVHPVQHAVFGTQTDNMVENILNLDSQPANLDTNDTVTECLNISSVKIDEDLETNNISDDDNMELETNTVANNKIVTFSPDIFFADISKVESEVEVINNELKNPDENEAK